MAQLHAQRVFNKMNGLKPAPSKIIGLQFSILSAEEILKGSVAEITSKDTYDNSIPKISGVLDPRMGVLDDGLICPTDGLTNMLCPGYFGHITLAKPVFYMQFIDTIFKVLKCICFRCSKLKISKTKHRALLNLPAHERFATVYQLASTIKRCGQVTDEGCCSKQPDSIVRGDLGRITATWNGPPVKLHVFTPEVVLRCFRRISDEDVFFLGLNPTWSRPDWMICQVLAVPPPAVRPSVRVNSQQRSEDDLTTSIINIVKANKLLAEKIANNSDNIDMYAQLLQYHVATMVDNNIHRVDSIALRSNRPLKSIKDRLNGKTGRVRGNLMGKRVDFSARTVITPDPNISVAQLGVPMKIAKNMTKPVVVNARNLQLVRQYVRNGPDQHPGAKIITSVNGTECYLRNLSVESRNKKADELVYGDIVHRHLMDGDCVIFNRQPTLHRMSMMCHIAKVMPLGDTFRLNVAVTKPYNADFDGDEMNMHMPQDVVSESELFNLAAVPWQMVSPASSKAIIGILQDSLVGVYQFTRPNISFTPREAMNLLKSCVTLDLRKLLPNAKGRITNLQILSQIIPPITLHQEWDDVVLHIVNGNFLSGRLHKSSLGDATNGIVHRICNDFGNMAAVKFIDDLQNIVTEYMKTTGFSVGISDLRVDVDTQRQVDTQLEKGFIDSWKILKEIHEKGKFDDTQPHTGITKQNVLEEKIREVLTEAQESAQKIIVKKLEGHNRFSVMVQAGSKGSNLNIMQMSACLAQQSIEHKRIPYGYDGRTLPHFCKYDDSPTARGFVRNSFIKGLSPEELFFHAMTGRIGIIDTAVKTAQTGYIQRRIIKGMEDLKVEYDMTVRNNKGKIIQFAYGDDGFDSVKVERQSLPLIAMTPEEVYAEFHFTTDVMLPFSTPDVKARLNGQHKYLLLRNKLYVDDMLSAREIIAQNGLNQGRPIDHYVETVAAAAAVPPTDMRKISYTVNMPVAFKHLINNIQGQMQLSADALIDLTPLEALEIIDDGFQLLERLYYSPPTLLFKTMYYYYLNPAKLLLIKRFTKQAIHLLVDKIVLTYKTAVVTPGETVGLIAAQSIGEPTTQMTLNTFHLAGVASKSNVTRGIPRLEEILNISANPKKPSCTVFLLPGDETNKEKAVEIKHALEYTPLRSIVDTMQICFDPNDTVTKILEDRDFLQRDAEFNRIVLLQPNATVEGGGAGAGAAVTPRVSNKRKAAAALLEEQATAQLATGEEVSTEMTTAAVTAANQSQPPQTSKWIIRMTLNPDEMFSRNLEMRDVNFAIKSAYQDEVSSKYTDDNDFRNVFRLRFSNLHREKKAGSKNIDPSDHLFVLKDIQEGLLNNLILGGIEGIQSVNVRQLKSSVVENDFAYFNRETWVLDTEGTNLLSLLGLNYIDTTRTYSNDIREVHYVLGVEAARQLIFMEITEVMEHSDVHINYHHLSLLVDRMTCRDKMVAIDRHGINNDDIGPIAKASFEETPEMFLKAARHGELDCMRGVSANVMCGQEGYYGTSAFEVIVDLNRLPKVVQHPVNVQNMSIDLMNMDTDVLYLPNELVKTVIQKMTALAVRERNVADLVFKNFRMALNPVKLNLSRFNIFV